MNNIWTVVLAWWPRLSIDRVDVNVINRDTRAAGPWLAGRAAFYGMHMLDSTAAAAATAMAATRPRARSHLRSTHTQRALDSTTAPPHYDNYLVSVLNEIHHQQNSIQINKILHEHGIKHKSKENIECRERCVKCDGGGRRLRPTLSPPAPPMLRYSFVKRKH